MFERLAPSSRGSVPLWPLCQFVQWLTDEKLDEVMQIHSLAVYNRYKDFPGIYNVSIVNMHEDPGNFNTYKSFACDHMDNAPHLCEVAKSMSIKRINTSKNGDWKIFTCKIISDYNIGFG